MFKIWNVQDRFLRSNTGFIKFHIQQHITFMANISNSVILDPWHSDVSKFFWQFWNDLNTFLENIRYNNQVQNLKSSEIVSAINYDEFLKEDSILRKFIDGGESLRTESHSFWLGSSRRCRIVMLTSRKLMRCRSSLDFSIHI